MSMHYEAEFGYGLLLNKSEAKYFKRHYAAAKDICYDDVCYEIVASDFSRDYDQLDITYLDGKPHSEEPEREGMFIYSRNQGNIFNQGIGLYKDINQMIDEFYHEYGEYLPIDFDYRAHICQFIGTVLV